LSAFHLQSGHSADNFTSEHSSFLRFRQSRGFMHRSQSFRVGTAATVLVAALGYFVDIYDLLLFSIVRVESLKSLAVAPERILSDGAFLLNAQMLGIVIGGVAWGVLGDRRGRLSILFGSIFLYSVANFANAFVTDVPTYAALRFVAGFGLAGELGAAVTLVSEVMRRESRGYGTTLVAAVGALGAIAAALVAQIFPWRTAYVIGGVLGFSLLLARLGVAESSLFDTLKQTNVRRGDVIGLLKSPQRAAKYIRCTLLGVPFVYVIGILVTFSPEIAKNLAATGPVVAGRSVLAAYVGMTVGDLASGFLSQRAASRKKIVFLFLGATATLLVAFSLLREPSPSVVYGVCGALGFAVGYWAVFVTMAAEQFGTNVRATVATSVPNLARGATLPLTFAFQALGPGLGLANAALLVGGVCVLAAVVALAGLEETFGREMDFLET
jgi:MFS transporter, putative metabolite:H+ symporter